MAITPSFREVVSNGNVKGIRIMMKDSLLVDPTFVEYNEMSRLASTVVGLYDQHDGRELLSEKSTWDDNYMDKLMVQVVSNFSKERLDHLKAVVKHLRPVKIGVQTQSATLRTSSSTPRRTEDNPQPRTERTPHRDYQERKRQDQRNGDFRGVKIGAGAVVGGAAGGTIAAAAGWSVILGVVIGSVVAGVAVAIATNGE